MEMQHVKQFTTLRNMKRSHEPITYVSDRSYHQPMTPPASISLYSDNPQTPTHHSLHPNSYHTWCDSEGYMHGRVGGNVSGSSQWSPPQSSDGMVWAPDGAPSRKRMKMEYPSPPSDLHRPMWNGGSQVSRPEAELHTQRNQDQSVSMVSNAFAQLSPETKRKLFCSEFRTTPDNELRTPTKHDESITKGLEEFAQLSPEAKLQVSFRDFWTKYAPAFPTPRNSDESIAMAVEAVDQMSPETKRRLFSSPFWTRGSFGYFNSGGWGVSSEQLRSETDD